MAINYNPPVVTDGLVLALDAANVRSFRGEPTTNLISSSGIDVSVYSEYSGMIFSRVPEKEAESGFALEMTIDTATSGSAARSRLGSADNIPTSGFAFVSVYAKFAGGPPANIRVRVYTGLVWGYLDPLDGGSIYLTSEYRRFGAYLEFGTNSGGPNPGFSMTKGNGDAQAGQKTRWHSPQVELKEYATPFVIGTRGNTVATGGGWADLSGNSNHGTLVNDVTFSSENRGSLVFNGVDTRIDTDYKTNGGDYTLEALVNPYTLESDSGNTMVIFGEIVTTSTTFGAWTYYQNERFGMGHFKSIGGDYDLELTSPLFPINNFYHVCFVRINAVSHTIYVNGINQGSASCTNVTNTSSNPIRIGKDYYSASRHFNGEINSVKIYNKALTEQEVKQNFNALRYRYGI